MPCWQSSTKNHSTEEIGEIPSLYTTSHGWFDSWTNESPTTFALPLHGPTSNSKALRHLCCESICLLEIILALLAQKRQPPQQIRTSTWNLCSALCGACVSPSWLCITLSAFCVASSVCLSASLLSILGSGEDPLAKTPFAPLCVITRKSLRCL